VHRVPGLRPPTLPIDGCNISVHLY
jgi:hypothetical protein